MCVSCSNIHILLPLVALSQCITLSHTSPPNSSKTSGTQAQTTPHGADGDSMRFLIHAETTRVAKMQGGLQVCCSSAQRCLACILKAIRSEQKEKRGLQECCTDAALNEVEEMTKALSGLPFKQGPKKARTAQRMFNEHIFPKILQECPDIWATEVVQLQNAKWKELSAEDKKIWAEKAKAEEEVCMFRRKHVCVY